MAQPSKIKRRDARMNRKTFVIILVLSAACIAALLVTRRAAPPSIVGRWHRVGVGGGEQMIFMGGGDMQVNDTLGSYTWIDAEHLRVEFASGSPRLIWFSPRTGDMIWTNHELGLVLQYTNEPGSFAKVRINKALGL
jgi:hypothetical protein